MCFLLAWNTRFLSDSKTFQKVNSAQRPGPKHSIDASAWKSSPQNMFWRAEAGDAIDLPGHCFQMPTMEGFFCPISATIMPTAQICVLQFVIVKLADHKSAFAVIQETVLLTGQIQWQLSMVAPMRGTTLRGLVYAMSNGAPDVLIGFDMCWCFIAVCCLASQVVQRKATSQSGHHFSNHRPLGQNAVRVGLQSVSLVSFSLTESHLPATYDLDHYCIIQVEYRTI